MDDDKKTDKKRSELFLEILRERQKSQGKSSILDKRQGKYQQVRNEPVDKTDKRSRLKGRIKHDSSTAKGNVPSASPPKSSPKIRPRF